MRSMEIELIIIFVITLGGLNYVLIEDAIEKKHLYKEAEQLCSKEGGTLIPISNWSVCAKLEIIKEIKRIKK